MKYAGKTIVGITTRTTNRENQAMHDLGLVWETFMREGIADKVPHRIGNEVYALYTGYEGDFMDPYDFVLGCEVEKIDSLPEGMVSCTIPENEYNHYPVKGKLPDSLIQKWMEIWSTDLKRLYGVDLEVYDDRALGKESGEIDIFIGVKES